VNNWGVTGAGAVTLDVGIAGNGASGNINTPTISSPTSGDLLYCFAASENAASAAVSPWTIDPNGVGGFGELGEYILSASGSQACAITQISGHWDTIAAAFK
jgi:hypothetical protein